MSRVNVEQSDWLTLGFIFQLCDIRLHTSSVGTIQEKHVTDRQGQYKVFFK